ncbi:radical SAM protein [Candidatus Falkowbacteria bacterium]|nr:radical SAM protein [Candidatus Falkowbacteria bacterium]
MNIKTIWLFVTNQCNLDCTYCYIRKNPKDINLNTAYKIIDKLISDTFFNEYHVVLFGGEPLLKIDLIKKIVTYGYKKSEIKNKKITFSIYSNGTLMNEKNVKTLYKLGVGLDLSLDGIRESQDQERLFKNKKSSFDIISQNIPTLLKYYPNSMVHACVTPANVKYLSKNIDFFYNKDFKRVYIQPIITTNWPIKDLTIFQKELSLISPG